VTWSTVVFLLDKSDLRIWNSFFLQFMWEFMLGMAIARWKDKSFLNAKFNNFKLLLFTISGLTMYAFLAFKGGQIGRLYNDIPALIGYTGLAILIYNLGIKQITSFFLFTGKISYALYLSHVLVINLILYIFKGLNFPLSPVQLLLMSFVLCYIFAYGYTYFIDLIYQFNGRRNK